MQLELSVLDETGEHGDFHELRKDIDESGCPDLRTEHQDLRPMLGVLHRAGIRPMLIETAFTVILSSPVVAELIRCLRTYFDKRKAGVKVQITMGDKTIVVDASNLAEAQAILERFKEPVATPLPSPPPALPIQQDVSCYKCKVRLRIPIAPSAIQGQSYRCMACGALFRLRRKVNE